MYVNQQYLINIIFTGDAIQPILRALADESGKNTLFFHFVERDRKLPLVTCPLHRQYLSANH